MHCKKRHNPSLSGALKLNYSATYIYSRFMIRTIAVINYYYIFLIRFLISTIAGDRGGEAPRGTRIGQSPKITGMKTVWLGWHCCRLGIFTRVATNVFLLTTMSQENFRPYISHSFTSTDLDLCGLCRGRTVSPINGFIEDGNGEFPGV